MAPSANRESFRVICDWGNWIFPFDDLFDDGEYSKNYTQAQAAIFRVLRVLQGNRSGNSDEISMTAPIVEFHDNIWNRLQTADSCNTKELYARAMVDYCTGTLDQVKYASSPEQNYGLEQMLEMRRKSVCVAALFALVQFGEDIPLSVSVLHQPIVKNIEMIGIDLTLMHNDILSYYKEHVEGVPHNLVAVCRAKGDSPQGAIDRVASLIQKRHHDLEAAMLQLASSGEGSNKQLYRYVDGIKNVVKANLYWSFRTARFLTQEQKSSILDNRCIELRS